MGEDDETTMNRVLINLRKMFGNKVPEPTKILVTRWLSDPYSRGVHTFRKTGTNTERSKQEMSQSVNDKLFFAGAAIDRGENTVAAFNSGIAVANKVALALCGTCHITYQVVKRPEFYDYYQSS